jgi:hypothetical protein
LKLVLSRKGFDAQYGGVPSPIFPDGRIFSLPIPAAGERLTFADLHVNGLSIGSLVSVLTNGKVTPQHTVHLDPDVNRILLQRNHDWLPAFGQTAGAQGHLSNEGVGVGDLFIFYGWFRAVEPFGGGFRYKPGAPDLHVAFGWLRVAEVISVGANTKGAAAKYPHLRDHPHFHGDKWSHRNTVYVGKDAGVFEHISDHRILTMPGRTRSYWRLPRSFYPAGRKALSYHQASDRWQLQQDGTVGLQTVAKGQEFVLDLNAYPAVQDWTARVLE